MLQQREIMREPPDVGIDASIPLPQSVEIAVGLSTTVIYAAHAIDAWNQAYKLDTPEIHSTIAHCFAQIPNHHRHAPTRSLGHFETLC